MQCNVMHNMYIIVIAMNCNVTQCDAMQCNVIYVIR